MRFLLPAALAFLLLVALAVALMTGPAEATQPSPAGSCGTWTTLRVGSFRTLQCPMGQLAEIICESARMSAAHSDSPLTSKRRALL